MGDENNVEKEKWVYTSQPKQLKFHSSQADEVLYGGAAGGGKSYAIIWDAVGNALSHKNLRIVILRRTYPELEKSIIFEFLAHVPKHLYQYNKQNKRATFSSTNSTIEFDHCQFEQDVYKFQSAQYDLIYIDELTHWNEFMYKYILSRLRTVKEGFKPQMKCASNPGGVGHEFVRSRFIDGAIPFEVTTRIDPESGSTYTTQFIPSKVYDNEYLMKTDYVRGLMRLPYDERKALLEGDWDSFKGQFFKEWRRDLHVVNPFPIPQSWRRFRAMDWGYRNPSCILWFAVSPDKTVYVYKEIYVVEKTDEELASIIKDHSKDPNNPEKMEEIAYTIADPSLWSISQFERGESLALRFAQFGVPLVKADNNRISGASTVHSFLALDEKDKKPSVFIFDNCLNLIRTLPSLVYDPRKPEDVDTEGEDHAYDALRYGLMSHPIPKRKLHQGPPPLSFKWALNQIAEERELKSYIGHH